MPVKKYYKRRENSLVLHFGAFRRYWEPGYFIVYLLRNIIYSTVNMRYIICLALSIIFLLQCQSTQSHEQNSNYKKDCEKEKLRYEGKVQSSRIKSNY